MAKRFTDTTIWFDKWFMSLTPHEKLLWFFLKDWCDHGGIWDENWSLAAMFVGVRWEELPEAFKTKMIKVKEDKWFLKKFIDIQYPNLNPANNAHKSAITILEKYDLYSPDLGVRNPSFRESETLVEGLRDPKVGSIVKDKVMVKGKAKEKRRSSKFSSIDSLTFEVRKELQEKAEFQNVNVEKQYLIFVDYLKSKGKRHKDYLAAFRNWLRSNWVEKEDMSKKKAQDPSKVTRMKMCFECDKNWALPKDLNDCPECGGPIELL